MNVGVKGQKATYSSQYGDGTKALRETPLTLRAATILAHNHRRVDGPPEAPVERFMVFGIVLGINALLTIGLLYVTRWSWEWVKWEVKATVSSLARTLSARMEHNDRSPPSITISHKLSARILQLYTWRHTRIR